MPTKSSSSKDCVTCAHWNGARKLSGGRGFVDFEFGTKGECLGGGRDRSKTDAQQTCDQWSKMPGLK